MTAKRTITMIFGTALLALGALGMVRAGMAIEPKHYSEKLLIEVPVLKNKLNIGDLITKEQIYYRKMVKVRLPKTAILDEDRLIGMEVTRRMRPGTPLYADYVRVAPDVHKNTDVTVIYDVPGILLKTPGRALEDGYVGKKIKVMNVSSSKILTGTVIAPNQIKVTR